jgi:DNA modification methylase
MNYPQDFLNKVIHGDSLEILKSLPDKSFDFIVTDPPYGMDYQSARRTEWQRKEKIHGDKSFPLWIFDEMKRIARGGH